MWWVESDDLPGLVYEAPSFDALCDRVALAAGDLLAANGESPGEVDLEFRTTRHIQFA